MSRTKKQLKPPGKEYWKSRSGQNHGEIPGAFTKRKTHRRERRIDKKEVNENHIECQDCGPGPILYSCPLACGKCGKEIPGTGITISTMEEFKKRHPEVDLSKASRDK